MKPISLSPIAFSYWERVITENLFALFNYCNEWLEGKVQQFDPGHFKLAEQLVELYDKLDEGLKREFREAFPRLSAVLHHPTFHSIYRKMFRHMKKEPSGEGKSKPACYLFRRFYKFFPIADVASNVNEQSAEGHVEL